MLTAHSEICRVIHAMLLNPVRYAVAGVAVTPASLPASPGPASAARPRCVDSLAAAERCLFFVVETCDFSALPSEL